MGVAFSGTDSTNLVHVREHSYPSMVELDEPWDLGFHMANVTARSFLTLLGLDFDPEGLCGSCTLPEARRALMRARATFDRQVDSLTVPSETFYGAPRENEDGAVELRPFRGHDFGVDADRLKRRLDDFARFVEVAAAAGADGFSWG